jgi:serine protease inhibitor
MLRNKEILGAVNALTRSWLGEIPPDSSTVLSGVGVWPLLGLLADAADGTGRRELAAALGIPAEEAVSAVPVVLKALEEIPAVRIALAFWRLKTLPIELAWQALLPAGALGELTGDPAVDQRVVDQWASEETDGLVDTLPVRLTEETRLVLASAILVQTRWLRPFTDSSLFPESGPWQERALVALYRQTHNLDRVRVTRTEAGLITSLEIPGTGGIDVHLVIGEEDQAAASVMQDAARCIRSTTALRGDQLPIGDGVPGVVVRMAPSEDSQDVLEVWVPRFSLSAEHDLLKHPTVFGLDDVTDVTRGHFPGISAEPLAVEAAAQNVTATFSATGFEAAAVAAVGAAAAGIHMPPYRAKYVELTYDRPFGFFAVDRRTGLVLVAGWVNDPEGKGITEVFEDIVDISDMFPE